MKKRLKSIFTFLLVLSLLFSNGTITGFAAPEVNGEKKESRYSGRIALYQNGDLSSAYVKNENSARYTAPTPGTAEAAIYNGLKNYEDSINLGKFHLSIEQVQLLVQQIINTNADLFYASNLFNCYYDTATNEVTKYIPEYIAPKTQLAEMTAAFDTAVEKALSGIDASMSQLEKALYLHDYIIKLNAYDYDNFENDTVPNVSHSAYGPLVLNISVCDGYSLAYSYLLQKCGVNARLITSTPMAHAWNAIEIDGKWYFVDLTHDDPVYGFYNYDVDTGQYQLSSVGDNYCLVQHGAFLASEELWRMTEYSNGCYTGWAQTDIKCTSSLYDYAAWKINKNEYNYCDGNWYYLQEEFKKGDVNSDNKLDSKDALAMLQNSVGISGDNFNCAAGYVNEDSNIDSKDALDVLKCSVGLLDEQIEDAAIMKTENPVGIGETFLSLAEYRDTWEVSGGYWSGTYSNVSVYAPKKQLFFNISDKLYMVNLSDPAKTLNIYVDLSDSEYAGKACIFGMIIVNDVLYMGIQNDPYSKHILFTDDFKETSPES